MTGKDEFKNVRRFKEFACPKSVIQPKFKQTMRGSNVLTDTDIFQSHFLFLKGQFRSD